MVGAKSLPIVGGMLPSVPQLYLLGFQLLGYLRSIDALRLNFGAGRDWLTNRKNLFDFRTSDLFGRKCIKKNLLLIFLNLSGAVALSRPNVNVVI